MPINLHIQILKDENGTISDAVKREFENADFRELATFRAHLEHIMDQTKDIEKSLLQQGTFEEKK